MRQTALYALLALTLLLQGLGSAWAATRMASGTVEAAAVLAELPPCHREAAAADTASAAHSSAADCCGTGVCHCAMACAAAPALPAALVAAFLQRPVTFAAERTAAPPQAGFYGPPLRPPAPQQS